MLASALVFFLIGLIVAVLGFGGMAGSAESLAKLLFFVFMGLSVLALRAGRHSTDIPNELERKEKRA